MALAATPTVKTTAGWYNFGAQLATFFVVAGSITAAWIKGWPKWKEAALADRRFDFSEMREMIAEAKNSAKAADEKADRAMDQAHLMEMKFNTSLSVIHLLIRELERLDSDNPTLKYARDMLATAYTADFGLAAALHKIPNAVAERHGE